MNTVGKWIKELIERDQIEKFYHSSAWLKKAEEVKKIDNYECQLCKQEGKVTTCGSRRDDGKSIQISIHHIQEIRKRPELALSIWYTDDNGEKARNLITVCETHHNYIHKKFQKNKVKKFSNEERW